MNISSTLGIKSNTKATSFNQLCALSNCANKAWFTLSNDGSFTCSTVTISIRPLNSTTDVSGCSTNMAHLLLIALHHHRHRQQHINRECSITKKECKKKTKKRH